MRRAPTLRHDLMLRLARDEIERLKASMIRFGDTGLAITTTTPGSIPGTGGPTVPGAGVEPLPHVLYGSKHINSLRITDGGGLNIAFETSQVWVNGTFYTVAAGTLAMTDATTNYVFVNNAGAVAKNTTGFPTDGIPLATVVTAAGDITSIADRRSYLNAGAWLSLSGILTTRGDLLTRDATQLVRLGIGAAGSGLWSDGTDPSWTISPRYAGYLRVGSASAPTNITAGDLTFVRAFVGDTSGFSLAVVAGAPRITFDANDYQEFNQATDTLTLVVASASKFSYIGGLTDEFRYDAVARFREPAVLSGTVVLDTRDAGAGAVARLDIISHDAIAGVDWYRKSATDTRIKNAFEMENGVSQDPDLVMYRFTGAGGVEVKDEVLRFINTDGAIRVSAAKKLKFRDDGLFAYSSVDGQLDIEADSTLRLVGTTFLRAVSAAMTLDHPAGGNTSLLITSDYSALDSHLRLAPLSGTNRFVITTGTGYASILVGAAAATEALRITHADGIVDVLTSERVAGYLRVGSVSAPTNVTAGDLTLERLRILGGRPDDAFSASGRIIRVTGTMTDAATGSFAAAFFVAAHEPTVDYAGTNEIRALYFQQIIAPATGITTNLFRGGYFENRWRSDATGVETTGLFTVGAVLDSSSPAAPGQITRAIGLDVYGYFRASGTRTVTIPSVYGIRIGAANINGLTATMLAQVLVSNPTSAPVSLGTLVGIDIEALTRGTTNFGIRNASNMVQTGYARFGAVVAPTNVTAGDLTAIRVFVNDDSNFSLQVVASNPRMLLDSGDFLEYNRASNLLDIQIGSAVEFRISATYYEQDIETSMPAAAAAGFMRGFPFTTTGRDVPTWRDDAGFTFMAAEKIRMCIPKPMLYTSGSGAGFGASTTTAAVGLVNIPAPMEITRLSYRVTVAGANADNTMRFAIYSEDGQQKLLDVTHNVGTATGEQTVTFAAVWLGPGNYYLLACMASGTGAGPTFACWTTDDTVFVAGAGGEPDIEGNHTVVGGAAPATFDPTAITTPFRNSTLYCRLDGAD